MIGFILFFGGVLVGYAFGKQAGREDRYMGRLLLQEVYPYGEGNGFSSEPGVSA